MVNDLPDRLVSTMDSIQKLKNNEKAGSDTTNCYW